MSNVLAQTLLPTEDQFDSNDELHVGVKAIVDRSASDFEHMAKVLGSLDPSLLKGSSLQQLLDEAITRWRPHVRFTFQVFEARRQQQ